MTEDEPPREWLGTMPAQRFVCLEEMREFARVAGALPNADQEKM